MMTLPDRHIITKNTKTCQVLDIPKSILNLPLIPLIGNKGLDIVDGPPGNNITSDRSIPSTADSDDLSPQFPVGNIDFSKQYITTKQNTTSNIISGPRYQRYALRDKRLGTFVTWPPTALKSPQELSEAGFFYLGDNDNVNCFYCGGGVKDWERNDDAWTEHAKWYPECKFLEFVKGKDYVRNVPKPPTHATQMTPYFGLHRHMTPGSYDIPPPGDVVYTHAHPLTEAGITRITAMGFQASFIHRVIADHVRNTGHAYSTYEQLLNAVLDQDPQREATPPPTEEATPPLPPSFRIPTPPPREDDTPLHEPSIMMRSSLTSLRLPQTTSLPMEKSENIQCKICMDNQANVCFLPCGHLVACGECSMALNLCPICRSRVDDRIRVFLS